MDSSHTTKLLTVENAFLITGRGVIVTPAISTAAYDGPQSVRVTLRKPGGAETVAQARIQIPMVSPPPRVSTYLCLLVDLTKADVPIGTEIWISDDSGGESTPSANP